MTRLLFITQKVDKDDSLLGVYHEWIARLAGKVDEISVICLYRGVVELPNNVKVYSLGKENGESKIKYLINFYKYLWQLRKNYDKVFVHMNPEYILLGGVFWKLFSKKLFFWYNHPMGGWRARLGIALADIVFHTSPFAFAARYKTPHITSSSFAGCCTRSYVWGKKAHRMPVGVDTDLFHRIPEIKKQPNSILYLGRLSPIKYIEVLIDAAFILDKQNIDFTLTIAGEPSRESEVAYAASLGKKAAPLVKEGKVIFTKGVPNYKTPELYNAYSVSVNMTPTGSFDKTIIEAMACESIVVASNKSISEDLPEQLRFQEKDAEDLARALNSALKLSDSERQDIETGLRKYVAGRHDLKTLIDRLVVIIKSTK